MGITTDNIRFLAYARQLGVSYAKVAMLGRQQLFVNVSEMAAITAKWQVRLEDQELNGYAEPLFKSLGASQVDSIDHSDFENASIIHDLNKPIDASLRARYSVLFDGGTLEHVFNFPVAIKSCMDMLQVGGHFISITPSNNYCGHGFYQFSPEIYFSLLTPQNGFRLKIIALVTEDPNNQPLWFQVKSPNAVRKRVTLCNALPTTMLVIGEKISETVNLTLSPFQSDYENIWTVHNSIKEDTSIAGEAKWIHYYRKYTPGFIKGIVRKVRNGNSSRVNELPGLGLVNPEFFTKIEV